MSEENQVQEEAQEQAQEPIVINIQMTLENINNLIGILSNLPFSEVAGYIGAIRGQTIAQLQATQQQEESPAE